MLIDLLIRAMAPILVQIFMRLLGMMSRNEIHEINEETMVAALKEHRQELRHAMRGFSAFKGAE